MHSPTPLWNLKGLSTDEHKIFCRISSAYKWKLYHVSFNESFKKFCTFSLGIFNNSVMKSESLSTDEHNSYVQISRYEFLKGFIRFTQVYFGSLAPCTNWKDFGQFVHGQTLYNKGLMIWTEHVAGPPKRPFMLVNGDLLSILKILAKNDL